MPQYYMNRDDLRTQLEKKHSAMLAEIKHMEAKLEVYRSLYLDLDEILKKQTAPMMGTGHDVDMRLPTAPMPAVANTQPMPPVRKFPEAPRDAPRKKHYYGRKRLSQSATKTTILALEAAGKEGMTARELAELADMPKGTASARLTILKKDGVIKHIPPRYYMPNAIAGSAILANAIGALVVHSTQQDNND